MIQWIPGHVGLEGNEAMDYLASEATSKEQALAPDPIDLASAQEAIRRRTAIAEFAQGRAE